MQLVDTHQLGEELCVWKFRQNEIIFSYISKAWQNSFFFSFLFSPLWFLMQGVLSIVTFPRMTHHIFISVKMRVHFMWHLQVMRVFPIRWYFDWNFMASPHNLEASHKMDQILYDAAVLVFWKCTYSEMILGGLLLLQFKPSHENSLGTHGSPCQFLATRYSSLISMIASTIFWMENKIP